MGKNIYRWAAVLTAMLVLAACGSGSDSFVRNVAAPDFDEPGSFTDFGQYNGEVDYMDHDFKIAAPDEYPNPGDPWLGEKYLSPSFECKSDRLTVSMDAKTDLSVNQQELELLEQPLGEDFLDLAVARYGYSGGLESFFNEVGYVTTDVGTTVASLPDGGYSILDPTVANSEVTGLFMKHMVVANEFIYSAGVAFLDNNLLDQILFLTRYTLDGFVDSSFGDAGWVFFEWPKPKDTAFVDLLVFDDGDIVAVGDGDTEGEQYTTGHIVLKGFKSDGSPDLNFGSGGLVETFGEDAGLLQIWQTQGATTLEDKILVVSTAWFSNKALRPMVTRYLSDGSLDQTFGTGGFKVLEVPFPPANDETVRARGRDVAVSDGQIYVSTSRAVKTDYTEFDYYYRVHRLSLSGQVDPSFGGSPGVSLERYSELGVNPILADSLFAYGEIKNPSGGSGWSTVITPLPSSGLVSSDAPYLTDPKGGASPLVEMHNDGYLARQSMGNDLTIRRINSDGSQDPSYFEELGLELGPAEINQLESNSDGTILGLGIHHGNNASAPSDSTRWTFNSGSPGVLIRLLPNGHLDQTFGPSSNTTNGFRSADAAVDVLFSNGGLVVFGDTVADFGGKSPRVWVLTKYNIDGSINHSFGDNGFALTQLGWQAKAKAISIDSEGHIYAAGIVDEKLALSKYSSDGWIDEDFGHNGYLKTSIAGRPAGANAVAVDGDDRPVVGGYVQLGNRRYPAVQRYAINGDLDPDFGYSGTVITKVGKSAEIHDLVIQGDNIIAVGHVDTPSGSDILVLRYKPNGSLDPSFGKGGKVITDLGTKGDRANAVTLDRRGRIVVTGVRGGSDNDFVTLRYRSDGKLDSSFGTAGVATTDLGSPVEQATDVKIDANGRIVVSGTTGKDNDAVFGVVRYKPNGFHDPSFSDDGVVTTNIGIGPDHANGLVLLKSQLPIVVGSSIGAEWNELFPDYNVTIEGYFASAPKLGTKTTAQQAGTTADQLTLDIMYSAGKTKAVFLHVIRDEDTAEFVGAVETTMNVEFDGPPSNRTCAVSMNFASTYKQPWK
jgi:uncharacterized delta-60 repeat protein